jgi:Undecaprenyl-phosphate glucose phosphotransferase
MNYVKRNFSAPKSVALGPLNPPAQLRWTIPYRAIVPLAMAIDALAIFAASILSSFVYHAQVLGMANRFGQSIGFAAVVAALFIAFAKSRHLYTLTELLNFKAQARKIAALWIAIFLFLTAIAFIMKIGGDFSRGATLSFAISGLAILIASRASWRIYLADGLAVRRFAGRKVVVISEESELDGEESGLDDHVLLEALVRHGLQIVSHFVLPVNHAIDKRGKEIITKTIASVRGSNVEEIVVSAKLERWPELKDLLTELRVLPLPVNLVPTGPMAELFHLASHTIGNEVTIELQRGPRTLTERAVKRVVDVTIALLGLIMFSPILLIAAVAIKLDSRGPVIFRQWRCGFNGRPFQILKFRTMSVMEDGDFVAQAKPNDIRNTRVGNWLRRTSIDELPQLLNVLRGSMSIVGPRPHATAHDDKFETLVGNYPYRQHVKPGLTGWAQVHGRRGETRTVADIEQRLKFDLWYINNWNLTLDFRIMFMTMFEVIRGRNAY